MQKAVLTLYTAIGNPKRIPEAIQKQFQEATSDLQSGPDEIQLTLPDNSMIHFNLSHQQDKPEFIKNHIGGMANFFSQAETGQVELKRNVIRQIQRFNCVTGITFYLNEQEERTRFILEAIYRIAKEIQGFILYPGMQIHTSEGKLLFSAKGESEFTDFHPITNADLLEMSQSQASIKSREEMVQRAVALFTVSVYSEALLTNQASREEALACVNRMEALYGAKAYLSPKEKAYLNNPSPEEQICIQFVWRYEACATLLWAAGITDELPYPSEIVDIPILSTIFWEHKGIAKLLAKGFARPDSEILEEVALTRRYDQACAEARLHGKEMPDSLNSGIVIERLYTLNWITGVNEGTEWEAF